MPSPPHIHKEKGNDAFKRGDYVNAIGHYTDAILADRKEPVFLLNRAAAYLKLDKNEDAERDASAALALDPKHVKALFRRAQARIALEKWGAAVDDLQTLLKLDPKNESAKVELDKAMHQAQKVPSKKTERRRVPIAVVEDAVPEASTSQPIRRRVPITIVDSEEPISKPPPEKPLKSILKPSPSPSTSAAQSRSPPPKSTPLNVGGGIFRKDGSRTLFNTTSQASPSLITPGLGYTLFALSRALSATKDPAERWAIFSSIPPLELPTILSSISLDGPIMTLILSAISYGAKHSTDKESISYYLTVLAKAPRFSTVRLFLSANEKELVREIWDTCEPLDEQSKEARKKWIV